MIISNNEIRKQGLDPKYQLMLENDMKRLAKKPGIMWILWLFCGPIGVHRYYRKILSCLRNAVGLHLHVLYCGFFWWIVEAFLIHKRLQQVNDNIESQLITRYELMQKNEMAAQ